MVGGLSSLHRASEHWTAGIGLGACCFHPMSCAARQVLAHVLRPGKEATGRTAWGWYHWAVGWTVLGLATINVFQVYLALKCCGCQCHHGAAVSGLRAGPGS